MTTLRTAAQQALEALDCRIEYDYHGNPMDEENAALIKAADALRAALAEPVQEPVAWRWGYRSITTGEMDWRGYVEIAAHPNLRSPEIIMQPLYTEPQHKPLTGEEIDQIAIKCLSSPAVDRGWNRNLARAIERAHGIV